jgi:FkbM family methyltransferase
MTIKDDYLQFSHQCQEALRAHGIPFAAGSLELSEGALAAAASGDWSMATREWRDRIAGVLEGQLAAHHQFHHDPYLRRIALPDGRSIAIAIVNQQSAEWYGTPETIGSFDFLVEQRKGALADCLSFLDLGAHQAVWSTYYAMLDPGIAVTAFEPSILNVMIGLFNCFANGVSSRVRMVPFAVRAGNQPAGADHAADTMLVDFLKVPIRSISLREAGCAKFDFVKVDIEGYEFELLGDGHFVELCRQARHVHLEMHFGHLIRRGISVHDCRVRLAATGLKGSELYSGTEMFSFFDTCKPDGFYSFLLG